MSQASTGRVARTFAPFRVALSNDTLAFTRASLAVGTPENEDDAVERVSPEMIDALIRWRENAEAARAQMELLSRTSTADKRLATQAQQTMEALLSALSELSDSLSASDPGVALAAASRANKRLATYHVRSEALEKRLT